MPRPGLSVWGVLILLASFSARARDDLSGVWEEDYDETIISVEQWGPQCGEAPRSLGRRVRGLRYLVKDRGMDLYFKALNKGRSFSTAACHSTNKRLKPKERTLKDKLFLVNCATSESAKSYESGLYSFRIKSIAKIEYRETSRFSRNIKGSLCVHTRRVRRIYTHLIGEKPPEIAAQPEKPPAVEGKKVGSDREDPCQNPGKPARLVLTPARAALLPGKKFCPRAKVYDDQGCAIQAGLSWGKGTPPEGIKLDIHGCLRAAENASPGEKTVVLSAGSAQASLALVVKPHKTGKTTRPHPAPKANHPSEKPALSPEPEQGEKVPDAGTTAPVTAKSGPDAGPVQPEPVPAAATPETGPGEEGGNLLLPVLAGGALLLAVLILVWILRKRSRPAATRAPAPSLPVAMQPPVPAERAPAALKPDAEAAKAPAPTAPAPPTVPDPAPTTSTDHLAKAFCTTCGKSIPADARFCPYDRTPIYRPGSPTLASAPVCPTCKRMLPMGAKFCPYDRTKLG